ncbi:hypothetical protein JOD48_003513 [Oerskovia paurometabola]|nr:hypothetical protein [Oerskovia paurometabola]
MLATDPEDPRPRGCPQTHGLGRAAAHLAQRARRRRALDRTLPSDTAVWMHS